MQFLPKTCKSSLALVPRNKRKVLHQPHHHHQLADDINKSKLAEIKEPPFISHATVDGDFNQDYFPNPQELELKTGAQVSSGTMIPRGAGSMALLASLKVSNSAMTKSAICECVWPIIKNWLMFLPILWEIYKYTLIGKEIISDIIGSYTQFPVRLAWRWPFTKAKRAKRLTICIWNLGRGTFCHRPGSMLLWAAASRLRAWVWKTDFSASYLDSMIGLSALWIAIWARKLGRTRKINTVAQCGKCAPKTRDYLSKTNGDLSRRIIIPTHLKGDNILAFCIQRQEQRSFNIERIQNIKTYVE